MLGLTPPLEGGSERHIYEVSSRLQCSVLTQKNSICKKKIEIPIFGKSIIKNLSFAFLSFIYAFYLLMSKKRFDIIHIHENLLYFLAPILRARYKVIITVHGIKGFRFYDNKFFWIFFRYALKNADKIIAVSLEDKTILNKVFKEVSYIPNGVDLSLYKKIKEKTEKKIAFIGRIHEQKGLIYLLKAFQEFNKAHPEFKLEIIGDINDYARQLMKEFNNKNIMWQGYISDREEIIKSLKSAYCIILPSIWEGLPLTLFESLASARPVIVSDIPTFKSVIKDEALFFKSQNYKDLARKINILSTNKTLANELGKKGLKLANLYDWNYIAKQTKELYDKT